MTIMTMDSYGPTTQLVLHVKAVMPIDVKTLILIADT